MPITTDAHSQDICYHGRVGRCKCGRQGQLFAGRCLACRQAAERARPRLQPTRRYCACGKPLPANATLKQRLCPDCQHSHNAARRQRRAK